MSTRSLAISAGALAIASIAAAAVLEVSQQPGAPYATIQSAINAAVPTVDEVFVRCGRYPENIVMRSGVPVRGEKATCTFIDGRSLGPVVDMTDVVNTKLSGFTLENGRDDVGGGIRILRGSPIIEGNRIRNNLINDTSTLYYSGGGISVSPSTPLPAPVITRNVIYGNQGNLTGGAFVQGSGRIEGNVFAGNSGFAALYISYFSGTVTNNTISRNSDAGLAMYLSESATVANNVVANNGMGVTGFPLPSSFSRNDVYGSTPNYAGLPDQTGVNGNISVDPLFVSETVNNFLGFEPSSASQLTEGAVNGSPVELSGLTSPVDGRSTGHPIRDIGAKENEGVTRLRPVSFSFTWDLGLHMPMDWNFFRGDLAVLKATGVYIQNPLVVPGAKHFCDIAPPWGDVAPPPGEAWFYLAAEWGTVYGPLGYDSSRNLRPYGAIHCSLP